jgi:hypothetical protein
MSEIVLMSLRPSGFYLIGRHPVPIAGISSGKFTKETKKGTKPSILRLCSFLHQVVAAKNNGYPLLNFIPARALPVQPKSGRTLAIDSFAVKMTDVSTL